MYHIALTYGVLFVAIVLEASGSVVLEKSNGLTRIAPVIFSLILYGISFVLSAMVMKTLPVGILYSVWCGLGIILVALMGYYFSGQTLDAAALTGIAFITAGILIVAIFSTSVK